MRAMGGTTRARAQWGPMATFCGEVAVTSQVGALPRRDVPHKRSWPDGGFSSVHLAAQAFGARWKFVQPSMLLHRMVGMQSVFHQGRLRCSGFGRPLCPCEGASSHGHAQASTSPHDPVEVCAWMSYLEQDSVAGYKTNRPRLPISRVQGGATLLVQVHAWAANKKRLRGVPKASVQNCSRGALRHTSGVSVCILKILGALVAMPSSMCPSFQGGH